MYPVSVIMPAYNEGGHIYDNIATTREVLAGAGIDAEIVAVDDGSSDDTLQGIERAARDFPNVVAARNPYNMGKGMALRTGFDYSSGDIVVFLDADLDLHPSQIATVIEELERGPYDVVVTSKHHPESRLDYPGSRKIASYCYYMIIKAMFGLPVRDTQTGLKVFRREVLLRVFHRLLVKKFAYDVELLAVAVRFGFRVHEIPVAIDFKRELKWGRIRLSDIVNIFVDTLAILYRLRIIRYYDDERQRPQREHPPVLVVVKGCPPPDDVLQRLSVDSNTMIACIADPELTAGNDIMQFGSTESFEMWRSMEGSLFEIVGFLGPGHLPNGSWVKNAVRAFQDKHILAVCGPVLFGPSPTRFGKAAEQVLSTVLVTGPDYYLHSIRPARNVRKGSMDNVFVRSDTLANPVHDSGGISRGIDWIFDRSDDNSRLRYDPDVAVTVEAPPLFVPHLTTALHDAYLKGMSFYDRGQWFNRTWCFVPFVIWMAILSGWLILPLPLYISIAVLYAAIVGITGLLGFDFTNAPLVWLGIILDHAARAVAFPAGLLAGLFKRSGREKA